MRTADRAAVALMAIVELQDGNFGACPLSGFVVDLDDRWFWITAAHCLDEAAEISAKYLKARFAFQPLAGNGAQVDFSFGTATGAALDKLLGDSSEPAEVEAREFLRTYDVGFLHIKNLYVRHLRALGVVPFTWEQVRGEPRDVESALDLEGARSLYLLGIASETTELNVVPNGFGYSYLRLPVDVTAINHPQVVLSPKWTRDQFGGDVKGVSGGPVVLEVADGRTFVLAVQSARFGSEGRRPTTLTAMDGAVLFHWLKEYGAILVGDEE